MYTNVTKYNTRTHSWRVVRVAEFGRQVESKFMVVVYLFVAKLEDETVALLLQGLGQDGLQGRVDFLQHILQQHGRPELNGLQVE